MTEDPRTRLDHAIRLKQTEHDIEALSGQLIDWQAEVSGDIRQIRVALIGDVDSTEPGLKEQVRDVRAQLIKVIEQTTKTNGRVTRHDEQISRVWFGVWGAFVSLSVMWGGFVWCVDNGIIKLGG